MAQAWWVYVLACGDNSLYTGCTVNVANRVAVHAAGTGAKYTRSHLPVRLVYSEACADQSAALRREAEIKKFTPTQKRQLVGMI